MALIRIDHVPETIKVNQPLYLIIPDSAKAHEQPIRKRKVLYLLHGLSDDASAWHRYSNIELLANHYGLVVVMPSIGRSFYTNQPNGQDYFTYLMEEIPQYLSDVFHLQPKPKDTFIAGISMGGYGAMKAALLYPQRFFAAASFSGVLSLKFLEMYPEDPRQKEFSFIFGDLSKLTGSQFDPSFWLKNAAKKKVALPKLFISCGRQDDLYLVNRLFLSECESLGIPLEYHEEDAGHSWDFWGKQIAHFLTSHLDMQN